MLPKITLIENIETSEPGKLIPYTGVIACIALIAWSVMGTSKVEHETEEVGSEIEEEDEN